MFNLDREKNRISLFFIESPDFFSRVSRFSFIRGWQVCAKQAYFAVRTTIFLPPSWTLKLRESWGKSKKYSKGDVDGLKWRRKWGRGGQHPRCFNGHDQCTSGLSSQKKQTNKKISSLCSSLLIIL